MGTDRAAPMPSTGGDNALMDTMASGAANAASSVSKTASKAASSIGDVGFGQGNALSDVQTVNAALNDNGIATPFGSEIVDTDAIKAGQAKLSETTGIDLKQDGWVGPKTKQAFNLAENNGLTQPRDSRAITNPVSPPKPVDARTTQQPTRMLGDGQPPAPELGTVGPQAAITMAAGRKDAKAIAQSLRADHRDKMRDQFKQQKQQLETQAKQQQDQIKAQAKTQKLAQQHFETNQKQQAKRQEQALKARREMAQRAEIDQAMHQRSPRNTTPAPNDQPKQKPDFKPLPQVTDDMRAVNRDTVEWTRKHIQGIGDLGKVTTAPAVDRFGDAATTEILDLGDQYLKAGQPDNAAALFKDTSANIKNPAQKARFDEAVKKFQAGEDVFNAPVEYPEAANYGSRAQDGGTQLAQVSQRQNTNQNQKTYQSPIKQGWRDEIAKHESSGNYQAKNGQALGRYQLGNSALVEAGYRDKAGNWLGKDGVKNEADFLNNPQAQENALASYLSVYENRLRRNGSLSSLGHQYPGKLGKGITITDRGLLAAAHRVGPSAVRDYITYQKKTGWKSNFSNLTKTEREKYERVETRLRLFQVIPYR